VRAPERARRKVCWARGPPGPAARPRRITDLRLRSATVRSTKPFRRIWLRRGSQISHSARCRTSAPSKLPRASVPTRASPVRIRAAARRAVALTSEKPCRDASIQSETASLTARSARPIVLGHSNRQTRVKQACGFVCPCAGLSMRPRRDSRTRSTSPTSCERRAVRAPRSERPETARRRRRAGRDRRARASRALPRAFGCGGGVHHVERSRGLPGGSGRTGSRRFSASRTAPFSR
jgi:hypothetical protein